MLDFINDQISPNDDPYGIWTWVIPLCERVLNNILSLPLPYDQLPLKCPMREDLLSDAFENKYAPFANTIIGTPTKITPDIEIDGELFTYVDFEE